MGLPLAEVGWALTLPDIERHPVESYPMQTAMHPWVVIDFRVLVAVETHGVPSIILLENEPSSTSMSC